MKRFVLVVLLFAGCGPRQPGAAPNQTYFWKVTSSDVTFGTCSDEPSFRMQLAPLKFEANSYVIYQTDSTAKTGVTQTCERVDALTCKPSTTNVIFTVAGTELLFNSSSKSELVGSGGCNLLDTTSWVLTDKGTDGTLEITHILSLVDNPSACMTAEAQLKQQAPNKIGLEGCVVTFK